MDKAWTFGRSTVLFRWTSGIGLYVETIPPEPRSALAAMEDENGEEKLYQLFIVYSATCIKLPLCTIEIGSFRELEEGDIILDNILPMIPGEEEDDDDDTDDTPTV